MTDVEKAITEIQAHSMGELERDGPGLADAIYRHMRHGETLDLEPIWDHLIGQLSVDTMECLKWKDVGVPYLLSEAVSALLLELTNVAVSSNEPVVKEQAADIGLRLAVAWYLLQSEDNEDLARAVALEVSGIRQRSYWS